MSRWISLKTKKPKLREPVLVAYHVAGKKYVWTAIRLSDDWTFCDGGDEREWFSTYGMKVTHWRPQPKHPLARKK